MAEFLAQLHELKRLPPELHWFCTRIDATLQAGTSQAMTADDGKRIKTEDSATDSVRPRQKLIWNCLQLFAYDGDDIKPHREYLGHRVDEQLRRCDECIVEYYKSKRRAMEGLRDDYDEADVARFSGMFDDRDVQRITGGLNHACVVIKASDPRSLNRDILNLPTQMAIFEALCCESFLADTSLVRQYLDIPLRLMNSRKKLRVSHYVPAATVFLFDVDPHRRSWAVDAWVKYRSRLFQDDFDFAVRDPLSKALIFGSDPSEDLSIVGRLWSGIKLIVEKLDNELITHSLRAMEVDVFRIALEHLRYNGPGFRHLLQAIERLLEIAPKDFWESMGAIPPTTFIEQVFNNPQYDNYIIEASKDEEYESSALKDMLSWIEPFMESLQSGHIPQACRSLAFQLLDRLQADRFQEHVRTRCFAAGLAVIHWSLKECNRSAVVLGSVGRIVTAETLQVTASYIERILDIPPSTDDNDDSTLAEPRMSIVKVALALECKSLRIDQEALNLNKGMPAGFSSYSPAIWNSVVHRLDRGNMMLAKAALPGVNDLIGLEKFKIKHNGVQEKERSDFNITLGNLRHLVCQMLERIDEFSPDDLDELYRQSKTACALLASLFSSDPSTFTAGVDLVKSVSMESARREAIGHLLLTVFETTMNSISWSVRRIAQERTFESCPRMLKTCTDILDVLCDPQDGQLRTRTLSKAEANALKLFWEQQWEALKVMYEMTEEWSRRVGDSNLMKEFCRDTMQYSERFFDEYSIFAGAIDASRSVKREDNNQDTPNSAKRELLTNPATIMEALVKWLRLRDNYLASTSVKLTNKVLGRLTEWNMIIADIPGKFLEQVIRGGPQGRTVLTAQEKAELADSLEKNLGRPINLPDVDCERSDSSRAQSVTSNGRTMKKSKPGTIDLEVWQSRARKSREIVEIHSDDEFGDSDIVDSDILHVSRSVELLKQQQADRTISTRSPQTAAGTNSLAGLRHQQKGTKSGKTEAQIQAERISFREKRENEREAKKKRDAEALARAKKQLPVTGVAGMTLGEGSGLGKIGIKDKDHAPKDSSVMVSSESEEDSGDDLDQELFGTSTAKPQKVSNAVKGYNASKQQQAVFQGPVKKTRQVRSAKDMRARLTPDLTSLHKTILGWNFWHTGDFPPNSDRNDYSLVNSTFRNPVEYQNTFEPLLVLEAWQGFLKSKEEGNFKSFEIKIANRLTVDAFVEVSTTMSISEGKEVGISEADIVMMSKAQLPATDSSQPHCFARVFKINRKKNAMDISYRVNVGNNLIASMVPNTTLHGIKVLSITPLEREYGALQGLKYYDLCEEIIRAKPSPLLKYTEKQLEPLVQNYKINTAQAKAVRSATDNDAFTLIQGPPGSGKTKTIVAIVGALLTNSLYDKGVSVARPQLLNGIAKPTFNILTTKKLLVCAPSNAAVDELVMRFKQGIKTLHGDFQKISVVRLGRSDAINANILDVTLDELVNARLNLASGKKTSAGEDIQKIMTEHKATCEELNSLRSVLDERKAIGEPSDPTQERDFDLLKRKKQQLGNKIDAARDMGNTVAREAEISRRRVQQEVLDGAHVLCATLSGSGHEMFQNLNIEFETVIIDEAAQSIELSALIPLKYGCAKCILVGDPKQLPPTVLSREAARFQYEQSLFVRMQSNHPDGVHLLDTQYRMHPEISLFPSQAFYDGRLLDGQNMAALRTQPWHQSQLLGPYRFFDVEGTHQSAPRGHSLINVAEVEVALQLYGRLTTDYKDYDFQGKIGVITPYKSQLKELRARFARAYGESVLMQVEFNTTDAFQGRESEIIIFSCVRASSSKGIGFLSDIRRMNVGITRAKSSLWVLGNSRSLMQGEFWGNLIQNAKARDCYIQGDIVGMLRRALLGNDGRPNPLSVIAPQTSGNKCLTYEDTEMLDAPSPLDSGRGASFSSSKTATSDNGKLLSNADTTAPINSPYNPSGGVNGLNEKGMCQTCGSFAHWSNQCDNPSARSMGFAGCYRCGGQDHNKNACTVDRCLECGQFGHLAKMCIGVVPLAKQAREALRKAEKDHQHALARLPEIQRKRQLGEHGKEVPLVRPTRKTPPLTTDGKRVKKDVQPIASMKRKRDNSPPTNVPTAPRRMSSHEKIPRMDLLHQNSADVAARTKRSQPAQSHERLIHGSIPLPLKPPKSSDISRKSDIHKQRLVEKGPVSSHPKTHGLEFEKSPSIPESNKHTVSSQPQAQNITGRRENSPQGSRPPGQEASLEKSHFRAPLPSQASLRPTPVRKKHEASPFIIPKRKKNRS